MTPDRIYQLQGILAVVASFFGVVGYGAKGVLAGNAWSSKYMDLQYFMSNAESASAWPYVYWISTSVFLSGWSIAILLEVVRRKS